MTLYEVLGVAPTASAEEIKAAYRTKAKVHHPDAGGCREKFQEVQHAYEVLSDPARRASYDECGDEGQRGVPSAEHMLASAFAAALDEWQETCLMDPVQMLRLLIEDRMKAERKKLAGHEREIGRWQKIRARLELRHGEPILEGVLDAKMRPHQQGALEARAWIAGLQKAGQLAVGYSYKRGAADADIGDLLEGLSASMRPARKRREA